MNVTQALANQQPQSFTIYDYTRFEYTPNDGWPISIEFVHCSYPSAKSLLNLNPVHCWPFLPIEHHPQGKAGMLVIPILVLYPQKPILQHDNTTAKTNIPSVLVRFASPSPPKSVIFSILRVSLAQVRDASWADLRICAFFTNGSITRNHSGGHSARISIEG